MIVVFENGRRIRIALMHCEMPMLERSGRLCESLSMNVNRGKASRDGER